MNPTGFQHPQCYARGLGGCSTKITKEHYVTEALLEEVAEGERAVRVNNIRKLPPVPLRPEQIGLRALTGHFLCKIHNSLLSDFDTTAVTLFKHLDFLNDTSRHPVQPQVVVSGDRFERWMLKTLFGGLYGGTFPLLEGMDLEGHLPPVELLRVIFHNEPLPPGLGLFLNVGYRGQPVLADHEVLKVGAAPSREKNVIGVRVGMFGFMFSFFLMDFFNGLPEELQEATYRPTSIVIESKGQIRFEWQGETGDARPIRIRHLGSVDQP